MNLLKSGGKFIFSAAILVSLSAQAQASGDALYQSLGARQGISNFVNSFITIVLKDSRISKDFEETDMEKLANLLTEQFCELSGGPCKYSGRTMDDVHKDLEVTNARFNALAEDLQIAMEKHQIPASAQNKLIAKLAPMQKQIVTK